MKIAFTWDDGAPEDQRLFDLHERYGIPATFFVPTKNCEGRSVLSPAEIRQAHSACIAFGGHTATHRYLTEVPPDQLHGEILDNRHYLEDILGEPIPHFCLPGGKYSAEILKIVYSHYTTVRTADTMCFRSQGVLCRPTFHLYPRGLKSLLGNAWRNRSYAELKKICMICGSDYFSILRKLVSYEATRNPAAQIVFWGHSWEIEALDIWGELETLFEFLAASLPDVCAPYSALFVPQNTQK